MKTLILRIAVGLSLVGASVNSVKAVSLTAGNVVSSSLGESDLAGSVQLASITENFSSASLSGMLTSMVLSGGANPLGGLTFVYVVTLTSNSPEGASAVAVGGFQGFGTDVSYDSTSSGTVPVTIKRSGNGNDITFSFEDFPGGAAVPVPGQSAKLVIQTDATSWINGIGSVIDGVPSPNIRTLAPAVPEQTGIGIAFLSLAAVGVAGIVLRRQNDAA